LSIPIPPGQDYGCDIEIRTEYFIFAENIIQMPVIYTAKIVETSYFAE